MAARLADRRFWIVDAYCELFNSGTASFHCRHVHRHLWINGVGLGACLVAPQLLSVFPFHFLCADGVVLEPITFPLRILVSTLVEWIAHYILGIGVLRMGTQLFDPLGTYQYDVAAACSGIRSLTAIFLFATVCGFVVFRSPGKRLLMMSLAVPFAILGNLLRMLLIIIAAVMGGQEWGNYVHESTLISLVPYLPVFLGLLLVVRWLEKKRFPRKQTE